MREVVDKIITQNGRSVESVIPILQAIQSVYHYLPEEALIRIAETTDISLSRIYGISTFYNQFRHQPVGKHMIKVCVGTACHVKGAMQVYDAFKRQLKLDENQDTDAEGLFTIEKVACLGCCTIAPAVQIDQHTFGHVEPGRVGEVLEEFLSSAASNTFGNGRQVSTGKESEGEIRIGLGSCCVASGSADVKVALEKSLAANKSNVDVKQVGCVGICNQVPLLEIHKPNETPYFYTKIQAREVNDIIRKHFKSKSLRLRTFTNLNAFVNNHVIYGIPKSTQKYAGDQQDTPVAEFLAGQVNLATEHRGLISPVDLNEYLSLGGFEALKTCLKQTPKEIVEIIKQSGLRGRGGGGFSTGTKWALVQQEISNQKYVICNGDEGDPGAFMDRMLLESYPFRVIEGMIIAAYAVGADRGILYIRAEYPLAVKRIKQALQLCEQSNLLGNKILHTDFSFKLSVFEGAGAFICGEETALIASVEGNRGIPRLRPPYPSEQGLWGKPTLINNTETFSLISWIVRHGASAFASIGSGDSKGTKVFALAGKINRGGLIEVPMGITIHQIVEQIGGGVPNKKEFKAVQIGGPSGGCIPASLADTPIDFESLSSVGAMMGSGGLVVLDEDDCMVDMARYFLSFTQDQSCGQCTFCRIGTRRMLEILDNICTGKGKPEDLLTLEKLAYSTRKGSLCGLGKTAPNPVLSTLTYFRQEYLDHIQGKCKSGKCKALVHYHITDDCIGCTKCAVDCPTDAIAFQPYQVHVVDQEKCIQCDICRQICPVNAVEVL